MNIQHLYHEKISIKRSLFSSGKYFRFASEGWLRKAEIKQKNVRHTNLLSRRHFEAVPECCAQSLPVAASVTAPLKIPAQFDKLLLSPSSLGNTALQRRYSTLFPRYVSGVGETVVYIDWCIKPECVNVNQSESLVQKVQGCIYK